MTRGLTFTLTTLFIALSTSTQAEQWFKGNTHTHTTRGDGDSSPDHVAKWFHDRGYNFLILSEHNVFINPSEVNLPENKRDDFILIPGEEITGKKTVHTTAMNISSLVDWKADGTVTEIIQNHTDATKAHGGELVMNHPNYHYAVTAADMQPVVGLHMFELYNAHPAVHNEGNETHDSTEVMWDKMLTNGKVIWAVSSDDAHFFQKWGPAESNAGRGWVMVKADALEPQAITDAMYAGHFYATSGVILSKVNRKEDRYAVAVDEAATAKELESPFVLGDRNVLEDEGYVISFIGPNGTVLQEAKGTEAKYDVTNAHAYIRCKVSYTRKTDSGTETFYAWGQPVFTDGRMEKATKQDEAYYSNK